MTIQDDLKEFYDAEAVKYAQTREKYWTEAKLFLDEIESNEKKTLRILEFGCGGGRLLKQLAEIEWKKIQYIGVDLSEKLLKIAKKQIKPTNKHITCTFVCADILEYIKTCKQENFDYIIGIASFQHIPSQKERFYLMKSFYRLLKYEGKIILTDWAFSSRFLKKHQKEMIKAFRQYLFTRGQKSWRDILIPRKAKWGVFFRFYHIFSLKELRTLNTLSGFLVKKLYYMDAKGKETNDRKEAKNTILIGQKSVFTGSMME